MDRAGERQFYLLLAPRCQAAVLLQCLGQVVPASFPWPFLKAPAWIPAFVSRPTYSLGSPAQSKSQNIHPPSSEPCVDKALAAEHAAHTCSPPLQETALTPAHTSTLLQIKMQPDFWSSRSNLASSQHGQSHGQQNSCPPTSSAPAAFEKRDNFIWKWLTAEAVAEKCCHSRCQMIVQFFTRERNLLTSCCPLCSVDRNPSLAL